MNQKDTGLIFRTRRYAQQIAIIRGRSQKERLVAILEMTSLCIQNLFVRSSNIKRVKEGVKMNLILRALLAIVGVWLAWSQLGQLTMMINTRSINVLGLVLLAVGILLLLFAIKPNFLRTKRWWEIWK